MCSWFETAALTLGQTLRDGSDAPSSQGGTRPQWSHFEAFGQKTRLLETERNVWLPVSVRSQLSVCPGVGDSEHALPADGGGRSHGPGGPGG